MICYFGALFLLGRVEIVKWQIKKRHVEIFGVEIKLVKNSLFFTATKGKLHIFIV